MSDKLASWINEKTKDNNWSIREFGRRAGISHTHAARIVNSEVVPSAEVCQNIAVAFGVPVEDVLRLAGLLPSLPEGNEVVRAILLRLQELQTDRMGEEVYLPIILDFVETLSRRRQAAAAGDRLAKVTEELSALEFQDKQRRPFAIAERRRDAQLLNVPNHKKPALPQADEEKTSYETENK